MSRDARRARVRTRAFTMITFFSKTLLELFELLEEQLIFILYIFLTY